MDNNLQFEMANRISEHLDEVSGYTGPDVQIVCIMINPNIEGTMPANQMVRV